MTTPARLPREEVAHLGRQIYERDILPFIESSHFGEFVAIDIESAKWAVAATERAALQKLRESHPHAVDILMERVGYSALRSFGGRAQEQ